MRIAICSDHAGYDLKAFVMASLPQYVWVDLGCGSATESCDYPDQADALAAEIAKDPTLSRGVLICGSGIGIAIAGNRHRHLRVALCHGVESARLARQHNDANVVALGARLIAPELARSCVETFLETPFEGGRHLARVNKLG